MLSRPLQSDKIQQDTYAICMSVPGNRQAWSRLIALSTSLRYLKYSSGSSANAFFSSSLYWTKVSWEFQRDTVHGSHIPFNDLLGEFSAEGITKICLSSDIVIDFCAHFLHLWKYLNRGRTAANYSNRFPFIVPIVSPISQDKAPFCIPICRM
jgi:hypothetical protein